MLHLRAGGRGVCMTANEHYATMHGVKEVVLPKQGPMSGTGIGHEQQRWFQRVQWLRAGLEAMGGTRAPRSI